MERKEKYLTIWLTGLPCSGKTSISMLLKKKLENVSCEKFICLDGDFFRRNLSEDLGFSEKDRKENIRRISHISNFLNKNKINTICSFISPSHEIREIVKNNVDNLFLIYVKCSADECSRRDVKGMWAKAKSGEIKNFTGFDVPFDIPKDPDLIVDSEKYDLENCVSYIVKELMKNW